MKLALRSQASLFATLLCALAAIGCSDDTTEPGVSDADVIENYAALVSASYEDSVSTAEALHDAVHSFIEAPSASTLQKAKQAWLKSRDPYGETEAYRFSQGPIDNDDSDDDIPDGPEGLINSWPLDESYIDYVLNETTDEVSNGGIVNLVDEFPEIDEATLAAANTPQNLGEASETSVSTGYHAIEFLLWGQDHSDDGPGDRPYTDYVVGDDATAENQERRAQYLEAVTNLLVDDLSEVNAAWVAGKDNYRAKFVAMSPKLALGKIILGMGSLAGGELAQERMSVAFENKEQEDEHSCFSDNTLADLHNNAKSVQNVLLGRYGSIAGPGIYDLVKAKDSALADELKDSIQEALDNIDAVKDSGVPFDQVIRPEAEGSAESQHIDAAIKALKAFTEKLSPAAEALDVEVMFEQ